MNTRTHQLLSRCTLRLVVLATLTLCAGQLVAADPGPRDPAIQTLIEHRLAERGLQAVAVTVADGKVVLEGEVATLAEKSQASEAADLREVAEIDNRLTLAAASRSDSQIAIEIQKRLGNYPFYSVFDWVETKTKNGEVTLSGILLDPWRRNFVLRRVAEIPGVVAVHDHLTSGEETSGMDQHLCQLAAWAIYSDLMFAEYTRMGHVPIHLVCQGGKVTLEGNVRSLVERRKAESLVRQRTSSHGVINHLEVRREPVD